MSQSPFIASLPYTPSLAWAARPLASGARSKLIEKRSVRCLSVGCPSFGGQRTLGGDSSRLLASVVTSLIPHLTVSAMGARLIGINSQTARPALVRALRGFGKGWGLVARLCTARRSAFGSRLEGRSCRVRSVETATNAKLAALCRGQKARSCRGGLTETARIRTPVRQSRAPSARFVWPRSARPSRWGWRAPFGASRAHNPSVMGRSCAYAQAAPYLER